MSHGHILSLLLLLFVAAFANVVLTKEPNLPRPGDKLTDIFTSSADAYRYGGKEFDRFSGLDLHDFSARWYDQQLCRFTTADPIQEKYPHLSPYLYCATNPLRYTDPTGKEIRL